MRCVHRLASRRLFLAGVCTRRGRIAISVAGTAPDNEDILHRNNLVLSPILKRERVRHSDIDAMLGVGNTDVGRCNGRSFDNLAKDSNVEDLPRCSAANFSINPRVDVGVEVKPKQSRVGAVAALVPPRRVAGRRKREPSAFRPCRVVVHQHRVRPEVVEHRLHMVVVDHPVGVPVRAREDHPNPEVTKQLAVSTPTCRDPIGPVSGIHAKGGADGSPYDGIGHGNGVAVCDVDTRPVACMDGAAVYERLGAGGLEVQEV
mmetsp:Transcript_11929/g.27495  ORF Transcript_11929/g.27495 Transcript_11929/m.27495 type:complete len:260 (-) Transcript_11929:262-1041(-)